MARAISGRSWSTRAPWPSSPSTTRIASCSSASSGRRSAGRCSRSRPGPSTSTRRPGPSRTPPWPRARARGGDRPARRAVAEARRVLDRAGLRHGADAPVPGDRPAPGRRDGRLGPDEDEALVAVRVRWPRRSPPRRTAGSPTPSRSSGCSGSIGCVGPSGDGPPGPPVRAGRRAGRPRAGAGQLRPGPGAGSPSRAEVAWMIERMALVPDSTLVAVEDGRVVGQCTRGSMP